MGNDEQEIDHESGSVEMEKCTLQKNCVTIIIYRVLIKFPILKSSTRYGTQYQKTVDHIRIIISSALHSCVHFIQIKECARDTAGPGKDDPELTESRAA